MRRGDRPWAARLADGGDERFSVKGHEARPSGISVALGDKRAVCQRVLNMSAAGQREKTLLSTSARVTRVVLGEAIDRGARAARRGRLDANTGASALARLRGRLGARAVGRAPGEFGEDGRRRRNNLRAVARSRPAPRTSSPRETVVHTYQMRTRQRIGTRRSPLGAHVLGGPWGRAFACRLAPGPTDHVQATIGLSR